MKSEIKVPAMGESISESVIGSIFKSSGSYVAMDDEILELETDKVNQVLYAKDEGKISLDVKEGSIVKIGQVIGHIDASKKGSPEKEEKEEWGVDEKKSKEEAPGKKEKREVEAKEEEKPSVRLTKEDFLEELKEAKKQEEAPAGKKQAVEVPFEAEMPSKGRQEIHRKISRIRQVIAERLVQAQQTTAMLTTFNEVDMSQVIALREKYKEPFLKKHGIKLGFMAFFVKAAVSALQNIPELNSYIYGDEIVQREYFDIGIAVSANKGLFVPVVRDCDRLSFAEIEKAIDGYSKKAREGRIALDDLQGGGFTITNGGVFGSLLSTPILNPPQCGILGMHKIEKRPVVVDDQIVIRPMMYLALTYDHRIVDGKEAVLFLAAVKNLLEDPARIILDI